MLDNSNNLLFLWKLKKGHTYFLSHYACKYKDLFFFLLTMILDIGTTSIDEEMECQTVGAPQMSIGMDILVLYPTF